MVFWFELLLFVFRKHGLAPFYDQLKDFDLDDYRFALNTSSLE